MSVVAMETVVVHLSVKLEPMADGYCMVQSVGEVEGVTQLKDIPSLQELLCSDLGLIKQWQATKQHGRIRRSMFAFIQANLNFK